MKFIITLIMLLGVSVGCTCQAQLAKGAAGLVICIDPGHPSEVGRGTAGRHITEIHAVWLEALAVRAILQGEGVRVVMTKSSENQFVTNKARATVANDAHADLMVRLHCDGGNGIGSGFAVYCPDRQGRADGAIGPSAEVIARSQAAGKAFYAAMKHDLSGKLPARGLHPDTATRVGAQHGALIGSVFAKVPVVLVEMCVLTNPSDEAWIRSTPGRAAMAEALADASVKAVEAGRAAPTSQ